MTEKERLSAVKNFLGISLNQLASRSNLNSFNLYDINQGKCGISKNIALSISRAFPAINPLWLQTGKGKMVCEKTPATPSTSFAGYDATVQALVSIIEKKDEQINRLLAIIEKFNTNLVPYTRDDTPELTLAAEK